MRSKRRIWSTAAAVAMGVMLPIGVVAPASASETKTYYQLWTTYEGGNDGHATASGFVEWTSAYSFRIRHNTTDHCPALGKGDGENAQLDVAMTFIDGTSKRVKVYSDDNGCTLAGYGGGGFTDPRTTVRSATKRVTGVVLILSETNADGGYADSVTVGEVKRSSLIRNPRFRN